MKTLIEFSWRGKVISQFIEDNILYNDFMNKEDFWGEFALYGNMYQYQIFWRCHKIAIFNKDGIETIAMVDSFQLTFSKNYI